VQPPEHSFFFPLRTRASTLVSESSLIALGRHGPRQSAIEITMSPVEMVARAPTIDLAALKI
jgi:hypothetical protein